MPPQPVSLMRSPNAMPSRRPSLGLAAENFRRCALPLPVASGSRVVSARASTARFTCSPPGTGCRAKGRSSDAVSRRACPLELRSRRRRKARLLERDFASLSEKLPLSRAGRGSLVGSASPPTDTVLKSHAGSEPCVGRDAATAAGAASTQDFGASANAPPASVSLASVLGTHEIV